MFTIRRDRVQSPRNGVVQEYEVLEAPDGVTVLALTAAGELVLVEQFRHGIRRNSLELPSGILEDDDGDPVQAGLRELREETGYAADRARHLGTLVLNPAWQTTRVHVVVASGAKADGDRDLDEGEDPRTRLVPLQRARALVREGEIDSSVVVAALGLLELNGGPDL